MACSSRARAIRRAGRIVSEATGDSGVGADRADETDAARCARAAGVRVTAARHAMPDGERRGGAESRSVSDGAGDAQRSGLRGPHRADDRDGPVRRLVRSGAERSFGSTITHANSRPFRAWLPAVRYRTGYSSPQRGRLVPQRGRLVQPRAGARAEALGSRRRPRWGEDDSQGVDFLSRRFFLSPRDVGSTGSHQFLERGWRTGRGYGPEVLRWPKSKGGVVGIVPYLAPLSRSMSVVGIE